MTCYISPKGRDAHLLRGRQSADSGKVTKVKPKKTSGPHNEEMWERDRDNRHRHNGFKGCATMMLKQLDSMIAASTTTDETKVHCRDMIEEVHLLIKHLETRVDLTPEAFEASDPKIRA